MTKFLLATAASIAALVAQAEAQEPVYDWTGFYIGVHAGYGWTDLDVEFDGNEFESSDDGFVGGLYFGQDWQRNGFVYGVVGDFDFMDHNLRDEDFSRKLDSYTYDIDWVATARVRAGFAMDRTLFFASGGAAFANIDVSAQVDAGPFDDMDESSGVEAGGVISLGIERAFGANWTAKAEYAHYFFDNIELSDVEDGPVVFNPSFGALKFGIAYRF